MPNLCVHNLMLFFIVIIISIGIVAVDFFCKYFDEKISLFLLVVSPIPTFGATSSPTRSTPINVFFNASQVSLKILYVKAFLCKTSILSHRQSTESTVRTSTKLTQIEYLFALSQFLWDLFPAEIAHASA